MGWLSQCWSVLMQAAGEEGIDGLSQCWALPATISTLRARSVPWSVNCGKTLRGAINRLFTESEACTTEENSRLVNKAKATARKGSSPRQEASDAVLLTIYNI